MSFLLYPPSPGSSYFGGYGELFGAAEGGGGGGGGGGGDVGSVVAAFTEAAKAVGGLIQLGFATEYAPQRRLKLIQDVVPSYVNGIEDMGKALRTAGNRNDGSLKKKIMVSRPMLHPSPLLLGLPVATHLQADDSLAMEIYSDMIHKANWKEPDGSPLRNDGGNIRDVRTTAQTLFAEALLWSLLPEAVAVPAGLTGSKNSAEATVDYIFGKKSSGDMGRARQRAHPNGLALLFGSTPDTKKNRVPNHMRQRL